MWLRPKQLDPAAGARKRRSSWRAILHYRINKKTRCPAICGVPGRDVTRSRASANVRLESIAVRGQHLTATEGNERAEGNHVYIAPDKVNATVTEQAIYAAGMERSDLVVVAGVVARSSTTSDQKSPWCSYLLPAGEGAPQGRMRAELLALARKSPHPAVPPRPRKRGSPRSPREKERRPRRACNSTVKRAKPSVHSPIVVLPCLSRPLARESVLRYGVAG